MADLRLLEPVTSANDEILVRAIRHAILVERFSKGEQKKIVDLLDRKVLPDLHSRIERRLEQIATRGFDRGLHTTKRLKDLRALIFTSLGSGFKDAHDTLSSDLKDFVLNEAETTRGLILAASPVALEMTLPSTQTLRSIVTSRPFQGHLLASWFVGLSRSSQQSVESSINIGIVQGESVPQIMRRLRGTASQAFGNGTAAQIKRNTEAVVRTSINHIQSHAREATFKENEELIKAVQWVSVLDHRTTPICVSRDGKTFPIDDGPRPPAHWNCRSTVVPVLKSWKELGIPLNEAPPGTRSSLNGEVPDQMTYPEWLKRMESQPNTRHIVDEALGPKRAELWRRGVVPVDKFVDPRGKTLNLDQLRTLESDLLVRAGVPTGGQVRQRVLQIADRGKSRIASLEALKSKTAAAAKRVETSALERASKAKALGKLVPRYTEAESLQLQSNWATFTRAQRAVMKAKGNARSAIHRALRVDDPSVISFSRRPTPIAKSLREGSDFVSSILSRKAVSGINLNVNTLPRGARASFSPSANILNVAIGDRPFVVAHEIAHALEWHNASIRTKVIKFFQGRIQKTKLKPLNSLYKTGRQRFAANELAWDDKMIEPFMGKQYGKFTQRADGRVLLENVPSQHTEILSMGIEYLIKNPVVLARKDPEYFDLIVDILRGK
jgi:SPP1 gp7 family putative phage head morphogenesis protein